MALLLVVVSGCGLIGGNCDLAGCISSLEIETGEPFVDGVEYRVAVCVDEDCWTTDVVFEGGAMGSSSDLKLRPDGHIIVHLGDKPWPATSTVRLVVAADGVEKLRWEGAADFERLSSNGPDCPPACYFAEVTLS